MVIFGDGNLYIGSGLRYLTVNYDSSEGSVNYGNGAWFYNTQLWLTATPNSGYQLSYWLVDGQQVYGSTIGITMNQDHTVQPVFTSTAGLHQLSMDEYSSESNSYLGSYISVDGGSMGWSPVYVTEGWHTVSAPTSMFDPYYGEVYFGGIYDSNGNYYNNGDSIYISSDTSLYAYYG